MSWLIRTTTLAKCGSGRSPLRWHELPRGPSHAFATGDWLEVRQARLGPFGGLTHFAGLVTLCCIARAQAAVNCIEELACSQAAMKAATGRLVIRRRQSNPGPRDARWGLAASPLGADSCPHWLATPVEQPSINTCFVTRRSMSGQASSRSCVTYVRQQQSVGLPSTRRVPIERKQYPCDLHTPPVLRVHAGARHRAECAPVPVPARARGARKPPAVQLAAITPSKGRPGNVRSTPHRPALAVRHAGPRDRDVSSPLRGPRAEAWAPPAPRSGPWRAWCWP